MVLEWPRRVAGEAYEAEPGPRPGLASAGGAGAGVSRRGLGQRAAAGRLA
jgi:hypothetical protein